MSRSQRRRAEQQNVSLRPVEKAALVWLAARLARGNRSAFLASLIVKAAREEIGRDWEAVVTGASVEAEAA
jgi:hypothetical protein